MSDSPERALDPGGWSCPLPLRSYPSIVLGHGGGGKLSAELVEHLIAPAFADPELDQLGDGAVLPRAAGRLAFSTDSYVVHPLFFPGGSIAELAVHGTLNDLAMRGARPLYLSVALILEEGLPMNVLGAIVERMAQAARAAGVRVVTGDTKVVDKGHGHGCYITTAGIGMVPEGVDIGPARAVTGDVVLVSGTLGDHGMAVMSVREGLEFGTELKSDTAALDSMVRDLLAAAPGTHVLRDPTRGGIASALNEIAERSGVGIEIEEARLPVRPQVQAACEILGLDPVYVANEGKLLAILPPEESAAALAALRAHPLGREATAIGRVTATPRGMLVARTAIGGTRVVPMQIGEQLPRIC
jgi:hydrogenase expression/formation protein HypE